VRILAVSFVSAMLLTVTSCGDWGTNPMSTSNGYTLMESNFENQGQPSLSGWQDGYPSYGYRRTMYSFDNDVPPGGEVWSLKLNPPDSTYSTLRFTVRPRQPSQSKQFELTLWRRDRFVGGFYNISLASYSGYTGYVIPIQPTNSTNWVQDTIKYSSGNRTLDSLVVFISMFAPNSKSDTSEYVLLDAFKLAQY